MKKEAALNIIKYVLILIELHSQKNKHHANNCEFLKTKYIKFEQALINDSENLNEFIEWNKWFAPRIVYDGIGNKELLSKIEELSVLLNNETV